MSQDQRPESANVVDVAGALGVIDVGPGCTSDGDGVTAHSLEGTDGAIDPTGKQAAGLVEDLGVCHLQPV